MILYRHKNNADIAAEVESFITPPGKQYAKITVTWWNIGPHPAFCMFFKTRLSIPTKTNKDKYKYPLQKWQDEWVPYDTTKDFYEQTRKA